MPPALDQEQAVEAARYALLRRLAYAMRHHMVVHLQPIGMILEVMERRLEAPLPELGPIHEAMQKVNAHARAAVQSSLDVVTWLAPEDGQLIAAEAGVRECFELLRSPLNFRGFALRNEAAALPQPVSRSAIRSVLPAALLALTDHGRSPANLVMHGRWGAQRVEVVLTMQASEGTPGFSGEPHYRLIGWDDVQCIARAEGVGCLREGDTVTLSFAA
ncbi:MAG TPA: hypothetical protein VMZ74_06020 [Ramlibacter sp.]|nr:hypothetical protein [Ramlibacter sp.]